MHISVNPVSVKKKAGSFAKELFFGFFYAGIFIFFCAGIFFSYLYFFGVPKAADILKNPPAKTSLIYDKTGEHILYKIHGEENRKILTHQEIPDYIRMATVAAEDNSFYRHFGFDIFSIARALKINIEKNQKAQGASTITQQLARNVFFSREKTLERKILELIMAIKIERKFSKDEILDFYLNRVPYGSNAYGVEAAAETFFGKKAMDLTLDEAAFLAAIPKATTLYSPYGNNKQALVDRQEYVLSLMRDLKMISSEQMEDAVKENTLAKVVPFKAEIEAPHFVFYVKEWLEEKYGKEFLETGGLKIYTTLDYGMQKIAEGIIKEGAEKNRQYLAENAALVAVDPKSGNILAMVGSRNFFDTEIDGQVNVATSLRQPGSSFKPLVYAKAFEKGFQPETLLYDVETSFGPDGSGKEYVPKNYDGKSHGLVSMRQALSGSLNIPAVKTVYLAGIKETIDLAERLGIKTLNKNRSGLSLALGSGEVRLVDMVGAFSVFANEGKRNPINSVNKIEDDGGNILEEMGDFEEQVLDRAVANKINSVLSDNQARAATFGTNNPLNFSNNCVAAKTGTTQDWKDAWTIGFSKNIAVGIWTGNNDSSLLKPGSDGIYVAAPIWRAFMDKILPYYPEDCFSGYEKVFSKNMLVTGNVEKNIVYYEKKSGEKLSEKEAKKKKSSKVREKTEFMKHDILYYVNRNDPLGDTPPDFGDPMVLRWEESLQKDFEEDSSSDEND